MIIRLRVINTPIQEGIKWNGVLSGNATTLATIAV